ncbi:WD40 repeat domain-containing protein, partial [Hydrocoleum sp. CS-953]|uniref:WD40 repeat domain-containing protein n=1 Tax=Hydrocoleum sp. CS-953 TaxID=1671698 RepID=UPI00352BC5E1
MATASYDKTTRLWDAETGKELATLNHEYRVNAVAFSSDGKTIATASKDNTARLHLVRTEDLITEACRRLSRNLTAEEWQRYMNSGLDKYERTCEELPVHPSLIKEAKNKATSGEIKEAISIFKRAQELDEEIDLDPDTETIEKDPKVVGNKFAAPGKVEEGKKLAKQGKIEEAISLYDEAQKLDSELEIAADDWGELCKFGSLNNQAKDVMFACEKAVKLSPNNGDILHSRGVARALTGDYQGA